MGASMSLKHTWADRALARQQREYSDLLKLAKSKKDHTLAEQYEKKMMGIFNQRVALAESEALHKAMMYKALGNVLKAERYEANLQRIRSSYQTQNSDPATSPFSHLINHSIVQTAAPTAVPSPQSTQTSYVAPLARIPSVIPSSSPSSHSPLSYNESDRPPAYSPHHAQSSAMTFHTERQPSAPALPEQPITQPVNQYVSNQSIAQYAPGTESPIQSKPIEVPSKSPSPSQSITSAPAPMPLAVDQSNFGAEGPAVMLSPSPTSGLRLPDVKQKPKKSSFVSISSAPLVPKKPLVLLS